MGVQTKLLDELIENASNSDVRAVNIESDGTTVRVSGDNWAWYSSTQITFFSERIR